MVRQEAPSKRLLFELCFPSIFKPSSLQPIALAGSLNTYGSKMLGTQHFLCVFNVTFLFHSKPRCSYNSTFTLGILTTHISTHSHLIYIDDQEHQLSFLRVITDSNWGGKLAYCFQSAVLTRNTVGLSWKFCFDYKIEDY